MNTSTAKARPIYRVRFARITGKDNRGNDTLGSSHEIGSVWPRENGKSSIIRLDHIPIELTQHQGVLFLAPVLDKPASEPTSETGQLEYENP